jgi:outer membrane protein
VKSELVTLLRCRFRFGILGGLLLICVFGCRHEQYQGQTNLTRLWASPLDQGDHTPPASQRQAVVPVAYNEPAESHEQATLVGIATPTLPQQPEQIAAPPVHLPPVENTPAAVPVDGQVLTVPAAISMAFQLQPKLKASLETIHQARSNQDIAFAAFLPALRGGYSVGGYGLDVKGAGIPLPSPFTFIPGVGSIPVNFNSQSGYDLAELNLQWLIYDFGRRTSLYRTTGLAVDISQLQTDRAYQTVADEVQTAYYQVLRVKSLHRIAEEAVRRANDDLGVAQQLAKGGAVAQETVLRASVAQAQAQRAFDVAEEEDAVAVAALNLAIGLNICTPTVVADTNEIPPLNNNLCDYLNAAVGNRREFQIARKTVQVAQEGEHRAKVDFAPRILADGYLNHFDQISPQANANLGVGFIKLEWGLYEGGKRVAELDLNNSKIREASAQADSIAENIAFQVSQAYYRAVAARKGIETSRPAVDQTLETYRLVVARTREGDATPAELTDAEASLTRAQQDYYNSIYDYLIALAHLDYATGAAPTSP